MGVEAVLRLTSAVALFAAMALWEIKRPRLSLAQPRSQRWPVNLALTLLDVALVRFTVGAATVVTAQAAAAHDWGLFHGLALPGWVAFVAAWALLDFAVYLQHCLFHAVPVLWRLHRVHHADLGFDVTTGLRFHPLEIFLSLAIKVALVAALGPPVGAVILFELLLNGGSLFNHGNVAIPERVDRWLRWFLVTPDMHRVHHSVVVAETNSNFGFLVPWWDRLCGTYRAQPAAGHGEMEIGIATERDPARLTLLGSLLLPVTGDPGRYSLRRERPEGERRS